MFVKHQPTRRKNVVNAWKNDVDPKSKWKQESFRDNGQEHLRRGEKKTRTTGGGVCRSRLEDLGQSGIDEAEDGAESSGFRGACRNDVEKRPVSSELRCRLERSYLGKQWDPSASMGFHYDDGPTVATHGKQLTIATTTILLQTTIVNVTPPHRHTTTTTTTIIATTITSKYRQKYKLDMVEWIPGKGANKHSSSTILYARHKWMDWEYR
ncbi:hypothetical protein V1478_018846 [Vespula squamosa]|uniref:Uncharacterized protein n=1 Tax=Vespula squamosa TaxID=30214 RepID=A0ABD1ZTY9_VESSQ